MAETMIERLTGAAWKSLQTTEPEDGLGLPYANPEMSVIDGTVDMPALARAVLTAMREPTEAMVKAADASDYTCAEDVSMTHLGIDPAIPYRAMIDAALAEEG